jgi:hypothetical protein
MLLSLWPNYWDYWKVYHKVTFDGENRRIYINQGETQISVKNDIYSSYKEWILIDNNARFLPAIRSIGGDPIGSGEYAGDLYFLMNGWRIVIDDAIDLSGVLYNDDGVSPYIINYGGVTAKVSAVVQTVIPKFQDVDIDADSVAAAVWGKLIAEINTPESIGVLIKSLEKKVDDTHAIVLTQ